MNDEIKGKIISVNLAEFSKKRIKYGYIGIELQNKSHIKVKVDAYTLYKTFAIGDEVIMEVDTLPNTSILVARKIQLISSSETTSKDTLEVSATT